MAGSIRVRDTHQKEFVRLVDGLSGRYSRWTIWADFITMAAISLSNAVDKSNAESREETYKHIEEKYTPNELPLFAQMFAEVVMGLDENPDQDFLGELYMNLDLGNEHAGQFFTPYNVCRMMSEMNVSDAKRKWQTKAGYQFLIAVVELELCWLRLQTLAKGTKSTTKSVFCCCTGH